MQLSTLQDSEAIDTQWSRSYPTTTKPSSACWQGMCTAGRSELPILVLLEARRHKEALHILVALYRMDICRFLQRMGLDPATAEDVSQLTFMQAYAGFKRFEFRSSLRTWLMGIARYRGMDAIRRTKRALERDRESIASHVLVEPTSLDAQIHTEQVRQTLHRALAALPPRTRDVVLLRFFRGLSYREIGRILGGKGPALQARVTRALPRLREYLAFSEDLRI